MDEQSPAERALRDEATEWLSKVRGVQGLEVAYRDSVLDGNAQNHARFVANTCNIEAYSDWEDSLSLRIDEGYTSSFSESIFQVNSDDFANELPASAINYSRLFTQYDAVGVGVAELPESANCGPGSVLVIHMASI